METAICLSEEQARRLGQLASVRGMTPQALVAEALESLFRQNETSNEEREDEDIDDADLLRRMEAELGPSKARTVPPLDPANFVVTHAVLLNPDLIRRPGPED